MILFVGYLGWGQGEGLQFAVTMVTVNRGWMLKDLELFLCRLLKEIITSNKLDVINDRYSCS